VMIPERREFGGIGMLQSSMYTQRVMGEYDRPQTGRNLQDMDDISPAVEDLLPTILYLSLASLELEHLC
jgi:hypothetical protein